MYARQRGWDSKAERRGLCKHQGQPVATVGALVVRRSAMEAIQEDRFSGFLLVVKIGPVVIGGGKGMNDSQGRHIGTAPRPGAWMGLA